MQKIPCLKCVPSKLALAAVIGGLLALTPTITQVRAEETQVSLQCLKLSNPLGHVTLLLADVGQKATVLFFLTTECPIGNGYAPEISRIVREYEKQGVICYGIYAHEKPDEITKHLREYKLPLAALLDPTCELARLTGATVTPEACILNSQGELLYRGRIDDRAVKLGTVRAEPRVHDLRCALDATLLGKPVAEKFTKAIGCYIFPASASK